MAPETKVISAVGPERTAPPLRVFSTRFARRSFLDRAARYVVTLGGVVIIGSILAILWYSSARSIRCFDRRRPFLSPR